MNIRNLIEESGYQTEPNGYCTKRCSAEFTSPCPFCTDDKGHGEDRFHCWPDEINKDGTYSGGRYWCRKCKCSGDALNFLKATHGYDYKEACAYLKLEPKARTDLPKTKPAPKLHIAEDPPELWQEKANLFVNMCHEFLLKDAQALAIVMQRGITEETIKRFKLGFNPGDAKRADFYRDRQTWGLPEVLNEKGNPKKVWLPVGVTIPTYQGDKLVRLKIRRTEKAIEESIKENRSPQKYVAVTGLKKCLSIFGNTNLPIAVVLESEFDAILIQQFADDLVFCIALSGSAQPLDKETYDIIANTPTVLFCPDFDEAGAVAWNSWQERFPHIRCLLTPEEKSPGDEYIAGLDLREWILEGLKEEE